MLARSFLLAAVLLLSAPLASSASADGARPARRVRAVAARHRHAAHVHVHAHGRCHYTRGRYVTRVRRVVVPGHHVNRTVPAEFAVRWSRGSRAYVTVCVRPRSTVRVWVPERVEVRRHRVWVRGSWRCC